MCVTEFSVLCGVFRFEICFAVFPYRIRLHSVNEHCRAIGSPRVWRVSAWRYRNGPKVCHVDAPLFPEALRSGASEWLRLLLLLFFFTHISQPKTNSRRTLLRMPRNMFHVSPRPVSGSFITCVCIILSRCWLLLRGYYCCRNSVGGRSYASRRRTRTRRTQVLWFLSDFLWTINENTSRATTLLCIRYTGWDTAPCIFPVSAMVRLPVTNIELAASAATGGVRPHRL